LKKDFGEKTLSLFSKREWGNIVENISVLQELAINSKSETHKA